MCSSPGRQGGCWPQGVWCYGQAHSQPPPAGCLQAHLRVGRACTACPRGALASRALLAGDVLVRVPINCTVALYGETMPKSVMELLGRMHADPAFNQSFGPWLAALPGPGDVLTPLVCTPTHMDMLQSSELVGGPWVQAQTRTALYARLAPVLLMPSNNTRQQKY